MSWWRPRGRKGGSEEEGWAVGGGEGGRGKKGEGKKDGLFD